ncbi:MAG: hypothetical protein IJ520_00760, partial [Synergistaceae bacterium]|nr:hypothetical protein [Synergistaceae bacterium]
MSILDEARKKLAELGRGGATEQSILDRALELSGSSSDNPLNLMPNLKPGSVIQGLNGDKIRVDESLGDYLWRKPRDTFNSLKAGTLQVLANTALGVPAHWLGNVGAHEDDDPLGDNGIYAWGLRRQGLSEPEVQNALAAKRAEAGYTDNTPGVRASKWLLDKYNAAQDWIQQDYKRNVPNPDAWDEAVHGVGTTVGSYLAGLGAYAAGMPFGPVAAGLMGAAASGGLEAANEGADVLANAYKQGKYNEGLDAANKSFITNMGLNTALDFTAGRFNPLLSKINNPFLRWLAETGAETVNEAVMQEPMQGVIEGAATNTVNDGSGFWGNLWDETAKYPEYLKEVGPTTAASTLLSQMMFGGANYAVNKAQQRQQSQQINELQELIPQVAEELYNEQQAQREAPEQEAASLKYLEDAVKRQDEYNVTERRW